MTRNEAIEAFQDHELDVQIIGVEITSARVAQDAAFRGLRIGLVEQADFASGNQQSLKPPAAWRHSLLGATPAGTGARGSYSMPNDSSFQRTKPSIASYSARPSSS